ncbi:MAG: ComEC family competence protein [Defluviitaleaceae bacterium]|nr:ComEC family competence protein [Defluviitaleaceae bacterium]MCL2238625.1 ComEC family competence protein [Defluviitaleaceae bacterium]
MMSPVIRPVVWALGFLVAGILLGTGAVPLSPVSVGLALVLGFCICGALYKKYRYGPVFFFVIFLGAGMWRGAARMDLSVGEPHTGRVFYGRVLDTGGLTAGGNQRVVVRAYHHMHEGRALRLMTYLRPHLPRAQIGQAITLTGEILPLTRAANPGGYDAFLHLRAQKIDGIIWPEAVVLGEVETNFFVYTRRVRDRVAAVFDGVLPPREAGIIRSMVLGDREDLDRDLVEIYRVAGIRHILSISGLHVTILTLAVNVLLTRLLPQRKAGLVTLGIMLGYCLMTGAAVATVRAVTMGGVLVFAKVLYRDYDLLATISWACLGLLLYEPLMLYNVGFQLSFGAVYGIALLTAPFERLLTLARMPAYGKFRNGLAVSMAATFSTYIVFAHHFYEIPLYSVFANTIIIPFVVALLVLGVMTGLVGLVWEWGAMIPGSVVFYILQLYEWVGRFFGALPFTLVPTGGGSVPVSLAGAAVLLLFAYVMHGFGPEMKRRIPLLLFGVAALMGCVYLRDFPPRPRITELYTPGHYSVHRHGGTTRITGTGRGGEGEVLRYLDRRGVRQAYALILTQWPRPGDTARIATVLERVQVLYLPGPEMHLPLALHYAVRETGVVVRFYEYASHISQHHFDFPIELRKFPGDDPVDCPQAQVAGHGDFALVRLGDFSDCVVVGCYRFLVLRQLPAYGGGQRGQRAIGSLHQGAEGLVLATLGFDGHLRQQKLALENNVLQGLVEFLLVGEVLQGFAPGQFRQLYTFVQDFHTGAAGVLHACRKA